MKNDALAVRMQTHFLGGCVPGGEAVNPLGTMLNAIWLGLLIVSVVLGALTGRLAEVTAGAFEACKTAVMGLALPLAGLMALWLGIMRLAEKSGAVGILARVLRPLLVRLFPDVPQNHPAMGAMVMNMAANMLGLANAATPLGLRAMQDLEKLNPRPGTATNAMCTFLALNTSSVQIIPATAIAILAAQGATNPTSIIGTALVATLCSTLVAIVAVKTLERLPRFALPPAPAPAAAPAPGPAPDAVAPAAGPPPMRGWRAVSVWAALAFFAGLFSLMAFQPSAFVAMADWLRGVLGGGPYEMPAGWAGRNVFARGVEVMSLLAIPFFLTIFPLYAAARRVPVYEEFVEGAKEGIAVALRIIPYLVAILAAVAMFRASGGIDLLARLVAPVLEPLRCPPDLLPLIFMRPLSGSGALGVFAEIVQTHGADSLIATMGGTIMGSTETTFYVLAVYFGSVSIRRTRHAVPAGLLADLAGVVAAVTVCNLIYG
jgi:spore maturation protein SpmA